MDLPDTIDPDPQSRGFRFVGALSRIRWEEAKWRGDPQVETWTTLKIINILKSPVLSHQLRACSQYLSFDMLIPCYCISEPSRSSIGQDHELDDQTLCSWAFNVNIERQLFFCWQQWVIVSGCWFLQQPASTMSFLCPQHDSKHFSCCFTHTHQIVLISKENSMGFTFGGRLYFYCILPHLTHCPQKVNHTEYSLDIRTIWWVFNEWSSMENVMPCNPWSCSCLKWVSFVMHYHFCC